MVAGAGLDPTAALLDAWVEGDDVVAEHRIGCGADHPDSADGVVSVESGQDGVSGFADEGVNCGLVSRPEGTGEGVVVDHEVLWLAVLLDVRGLAGAGWTADLGKRPRTVTSAVTTAIVEECWASGD